MYQGDTAMVIQANLQALSANLYTGIVSSAFKKNTEKLSSGYRINRSADDAAGLAISEKMRRQIRGLTQASSNAQDGISFVQIADGALSEVDEMLHRATELAVKAANETNSDEDRAYMQSELDQLTKEIDRVSESTVFNEINVFSEDGLLPTADSTPLAVNETKNEIKIECFLVGADGNPVSVAESKAVGKDTGYAASDMALFVQQAASDAIAKIQSAYPNLMAKASSSVINIGLNFTHIDGTGNVLASAALSMISSTSSTVMSYTMNIDTEDYPLDGFDTMTDEKKANLAATIAHEMTHLVMYDTLTDGMLSYFPKWFSEGMAQTASGDNGWVSYQLSPTSSEASIKSYMAQLSSMEYGAGYLATMYLGQAVYENKGASQAVTGDNIKSGLDTLMTYVADGHTFDEAIKEYTNYSSQKDFENSFKGADSASFTFVQNLLNARGTTGAGSLLAGGLNVSEAAAFASGSLNSSSTNYIVNTDNTKYANAFGTGYTFPEKQSGIASGDGDGIILQVGSELGNTLTVLRYNVSSDALFDGDKLDVTTSDKALETIDTVKDALKRVSSVRSYYGATQNRLEHTINNLDNVVENTTSAESLIRDTDMSKEMVDYSNHNIIMQAAQAMLAQANQSNQGVLALLQ
jgi:flagellin